MDSREQAKAKLTAGRKGKLPCDKLEVLLPQANKIMITPTHLSFL